MDILPSAQAGSQHRASLLPAKDPPKRAAFDVFPLNWFIKLLLKKGKSGAEEAAKLKARAGNVDRNIPLEITHYLVSYQCYGWTELESELTELLSR